MTTTNRHRLKDLFRDTSKLPPSKFMTLINSLWRDELILYDEQKITTVDLIKLDETSENYDKRYKYLRNSFKEEDNLKSTSWSTANGFGHRVGANFAQVHGYFNHAGSIFETIVGPFALIPENQTPDEWINLDRLWTLGNGSDEDNRSNAIEVFKSGYCKYNNAVVIGEYVHKLTDEDNNEKPLLGTIQFTASNGLQSYDDTNSVWIDLSKNCHKSLTVESSTSYYAEVDDEQVLAIDFSSFVEFDDIADVALSGDYNDLFNTPNLANVALTGSYNDLTDKPTSGVSNFVDLGDTPNSYLASNRGEALKAVNSRIQFASLFGEDSAFWINTGGSVVYGSDLYDNGTAEMTAGTQYRFTIIVVNRTVGNAIIAIGTDEIANVSEDGIAEHTYTATGTGVATIDINYVDSFDGTVTIVVQEITVTKGDGMKFLDSNYNPIGNLRAYQNAELENIVEFNDTLFINFDTQTTRAVNAIAEKLHIEATVGNLIELSDSENQFNIVLSDSDTEFEKSLQFKGEDTNMLELLYTSDTVHNVRVNSYLQIAGDGGAGFQFENGNAVQFWQKSDGTFTVSYNTEDGGTTTATTCFNLLEDGIFQIHRNPHYLNASNADEVIDILKLSENEVSATEVGSALMVADDGNDGKELAWTLLGSISYKNVWVGTETAFEALSTTDNETIYLRYEE